MRGRFNPKARSKICTVDSAAERQEGPGDAVYPFHGISHGFCPILAAEPNPDDHTGKRPVSTTESSSIGCGLRQHPAVDESNRVAWDETQWPPSMMLDVPICFRKMQCLNEDVLPLLCPLCIPDTYNSPSNRPTQSAVWKLCSGSKGLSTDIGDISMNPVVEVSKRAMPGCS